MTLQNMDIRDFWEVTGVESAVDFSGNKTMHIAAILGRIEFFRHLVEVKGVFVDLLNDAGETPLYKALNQWRGFSFEGCSFEGPDCCYHEHETKDAHFV